jgi:hypothetical protein
LGYRFVIAPEVAMFARRAFAAMAFCFLALPALGQTPAPTAAQPGPDDRAKQWMSLVDDGDFAEGAKQIGSQIGATPLQRDAQALLLRNEREPVGAMASRNLKDVRLTTSLPGKPSGQYAVVRYDSSFARKATAIETVTLALTQGAWSVIAYRID